MAARCSRYSIMSQESKPFLFSFFVVFFSLFSFLLDVYHKKKIEESLVCDCLNKLDCDLLPGFTLLYHL